MTDGTGTGSTATGGGASEPLRIPSEEVERLARILDGALSDFALERITYSTTGDRLFDVYVGRGLPKRRAIYELLIALEQAGTTDLFLAGVYREFSQRDDLRGYIRRLFPHVAAPVATGYDLSLQLGGVSVVGAPTNALAPGLERNVRPNLTKLDARLWVSRSLAMQARVCRVDADGRALGTGFLVGPDAVLTNWHVVSRIPRSDIAARITCLFDYSVLDGGARGGERVGLHSQGMVDERPYAPAEASPNPGLTEPAVEELDYALLRLAAPVGATADGTPSRGWIGLPQVAAPLSPGDPLLILQHPDGAPLKLALDTDSVIGRNAAGNRLRYRTNTDPGSSGSPCFSMDWDLVALHHLGDPAWQAPVFNQGVPAELIRRSIEARGYGALLGDAAG